MSAAETTSIGCDSDALGQAGVDGARAGGGAGEGDGVAVDERDGRLQRAREREVDRAVALGDPAAAVERGDVKVSASPSRTIGAAPFQPRLGRSCRRRDHAHGRVGDEAAAGVEELELGAAGDARLDVDLAVAVGGEGGDGGVRRARAGEAYAAVDEDGGVGAAGGDAVLVEAAAARAVVELQLGRGAAAARVERAAAEAEAQEERRSEVS